MSAPKIAIHLVTWNSMTHIAACLDSVTKQITSEQTVMIVDNASVDGTVKWIEEHFPHFHLLRNTKNTGYCRAHNQALLLSAADFVLILNADVIVGPDWINQAVNYLVDHPTYAAYGGKIKRFSYSNDDLKEIEYSDIIDSAGLHISRNRHAVDRGSGQVDGGQFDQASDVFGFSGCCVMYRRAALDSVRYKDEIFDENFFMYKEDIDLSWRLQRQGWSNQYDPAVVAHHFRGLKGVSAVQDMAIAKNHRSRSNFMTFYSYRNHLMVLLKNETWSTIWRDGLWIIIYEIKKLGFLILTGKPWWSAWRSLLTMWPTIHRKSQVIKKHAKISPLAIRRKYILS